MKSRAVQRPPVLVACMILALLLLRRGSQPRSKNPKTPAQPAEKKELLQSSPRETDTAGCKSAENAAEGADKDPIAGR